MLSLLLAASLYVPLSDWPREATELVERHGAPDTATPNRLEWKLDDRTLEYLYSDNGSYLVVESIKEQPSTSELEEILALDPNVRYDVRTKQISVWGKNEAEASRLLERVRQALR